MKEVRTVFLIVGGTIGAGFISGAELVRFFHTQTFFFPVLFSSLLFALICAYFLRLGKICGGYDGAMKALFGRAGGAVKTAVALFSLVPAAGMLAGLDALCPPIRPALSLCGLLLTAAVLSKGTGGISFVNLILVPLLLLFVFTAGSGGKAFFSPALPKTAGFGGLFYAGMNAFLIAPVLMDEGRTVRRPLLCAFFAAAIVAAGALTILGCVFREGGEAIGAEMPFLFVMRGKKIFFAAVALAIFTSLAASLYPLLCVCDGFRKKKTAKAIVLFAAFGCSRLGLGGIVGILYPVEGIAGLLFSAVCILDQYFFEKRHKKVHPGGKRAEDDRRAHHEVELKDLPAVDDQISESGL